MNPHGPLGPADFLAVCGFRRPDSARKALTPGLRSGLSLHPPLSGSGAARLVSTPSPGFSPGLARDCHFRFPRIWAVLHRRFPGEHSSFPQVRCVCHSATPAWPIIYCPYHRARTENLHVSLQGWFCDPEARGLSGQFKCRARLTAPTNSSLRALQRRWRASRRRCPAISSIASALSMPRL